MVGSKKKICIAGACIAFVMLIPLSLQALGFGASELIPCTNGGGVLKSCSISDIREFVVQTFNGMSSLLKR